MHFSRESVKVIEAGAGRRKCAVIEATKPIAYADAESQIQDGDFLAFERLRRPLSWLIGVARWGTLSHAAMAVWVRVGHRRVLAAIEMEGTDGGRAIGLAKYAKWYPGRIHVYRFNAPRRTAHRAAQEMLDLLNAEYDHKALSRLAWINLPVIREILSAWGKFRRRVQDDEANVAGGPPTPPDRHCSGGVSWAWRMAGYDPVPRLADWATLPEDLRRQNGCRYLFTLVP